MHLWLLCSHLQHASDTLCAASFKTLQQSTTLPAPMNGRVCLKVPNHQEHIMSNITSTVFALVLAAGISGMFFTATLV